MTPCLSWQEGALRDTHDHGGQIVWQGETGKRQVLQDTRHPSVAPYALEEWKLCLNEVLDLLLYGVGIKMLNLLNGVKLGLCTSMHRLIYV